MRTNVRIRIGAAIVVSSLVLLLAAPEALAAPGRAGLPTRAAYTSYSLSTTPFSANGWKWSFSMSKSGSGTSLSVYATKTATIGNKPTQQHAWYFGSLPAGGLTVDATDLLPTTVNTGTDMSIYGKIAGKLANASALSKSTYKCKKTGDLLSTTWRRSGTFTGSFVFKPQLSGLPAKVTASSIAMSISKTTSTGKGCPGGGGCFPGRSLSGSLIDPGGNYAFFNANATSTNAYLSLYFQEYDATNGVTKFHTIWGVVPTAAVSISPTSATLNGNALAPFASGKLHLLLSNPVSNGTTCINTGYTVTWDSGTITGMFVNGDELYTDPFTGLSGHIIKKV